MLRWLLLSLAAAPCRAAESGVALLGRAALDELEAAGSRQPCVLAAVLELRERCDALTEDQSARLALRLANCHWALSGRRGHSCAAEDALEECTSPVAMGDADFAIYTAFRIKVDQACRFIALQATQHRAERANEQLVAGAQRTATAVASMGSQVDDMTQQIQFSSRVQIEAVEAARDVSLVSIENLRGETEGVGDQLAELGDSWRTTSEAMLEASTTALRNTQTLSDRQAALRTEVSNTSAVLQEALAGHAAALQRGARAGLTAIQDELQQLVFGVGSIQQSFASVSSVFFRVGATVLGWALTASPRTSGARWWWFGLLVAEWYIESTLIAGMHQQQAMYVDALRRMAIVGGCLAVLRTAFFYQSEKTIVQHALAEHGSVLEEQRTMLDEILCRQVEMSKTIKLGSPPAPSHDQPHQEHRGAKPDSNDFASHSYREMQIELKRRGLKASGTAAALRRRLQTSGME